ncbi:MAG: 23S rRNA (pseudouridine(1915)-N(3))-methyltransferase RlmH [Thermoanaerobaculum sp.]|nr:23S rRNA (pseudouridine(1915)-N(3))-methyltransferase RlmH [Thermoanaerobaculum sp.]MDW7966679.1 23S rRNA (pseudouridine(1915)-N(3))-methyltransferase RlmH [Thermoanaerobaculum sp.]
MRRILLLYVGSRPEEEWETLCQRYRLRLRRLLTFEERRIPLAIGRRTDPQGALRREAVSILQATEGAGRMVALDVQGELWSTRELAEFVGTHLPMGPLAFVIGSDLGLHPQVLDRAVARWSLSPLTLPHPLVRLLVLEQLYRALDWLEGGSYHRGEPHRRV